MWGNIVLSFIFSFINNPKLPIRGNRTCFLLVLTQNFSIEDYVKKVYWSYLMCLYSKKKNSIKNIGWLIQLRCNSVSINEKLLELSSIYFIVAVQSWKSTTLEMTNGIKNVYKKYYKIIEIQIRCSPNTFHR